MVRICSLGDVDLGELQAEIDAGARFVVYRYCYSIVFMTVSGESEIYFLRSHQFGFLHGFKYTLFTLLAGWWGFPWGPIFTVPTLLRNLFGGVDVTEQVLAGAVAGVVESDAARKYFHELERAPDAGDSPGDFLKKLEKSQDWPRPRRLEMGSGRRQGHSWPFPPKAVVGPTFTSGVGAAHRLLPPSAPPRQRGEEGSVWPPPSPC